MYRNIRTPAASYSRRVASFCLEPHVHLLEPRCHLPQSLLISSTGGIPVCAPTIFQLSAEVGLQYFSLAVLHLLHCATTLKENRIIFSASFYASTYSPNTRTSVIIQVLHSRASIACSKQFSISDDSCHLTSSASLGPSLHPICE